MHYLCNVEFPIVEYFEGDDIIPIVLAAVAAAVVVFIIIFICCAICMKNKKTEEKLKPLTVKRDFFMTMKC